ncbi:MAG: hypothetical protein NTZ46_05165 [Verrucomicrobia bacterium]|nr:hypothetical protein [Verrucomicrobiota bacterium]
MAKIKNLTLGAGIALAGILLPASLYAGTETKAVVEPAKASILTGDIGINFVSEYISRGAPQEVKGVIAQPYADLYVSLFEGTGFVNKVSLNLGVWSSFHSAHTAAGSVGTKHRSAFYEFDYMPGVAVTFAKNYTLTASYFEFDSPNNAFDPSRNLNFNLAYNDTDLLGAFALHPHITYMRELQGKATTGPAGTHGNYYEVGILPALPAYGPVTISFPITAGFGSNDFYALNHGFGYFSGGVNAAVAIACIPAKYGSWAFNTGATYYHLAEQNAYVYSSDNRISQDRVVFQGGIGATF